MTQSLVNLLYGIAAGAGLYLLDVPYPLVWAALAAVLRFIPDVRPAFAEAKGSGRVWIAYLTLTTIGGDVSLEVRPSEGSC